MFVPLILSFFFPTMIPFEVLVAYVAGIVSFLLMYGLSKHQEATILRLKARNMVLSNWLQMAEAQTGTAYYSAVALGAEPEEYNPRFNAYLQDSIKNRAPYRAPTAEYEEEPTHENPHE